MSRLRLIIGVVVAAALTGLSGTLAMHSASADPTANVVDVDRFGGSDRYETAILISQATWEDGEADAVVLARGDNFPDALTGVPLAVDAGGPLLLSQTKSLRSDVRAEIERVAPAGATVYILGGATSLSPKIESELESFGYDAKRVAGSNRFETAVEIARLLPWPDERDFEDTVMDDTVMLVTGQDFPDALTASFMTTQNKFWAEKSGSAYHLFPIPILLTNGEKIPDATLDYLLEVDSRVGDMHINAVGGAVTSMSWSAARLYPEISPDVYWSRYSGDNRYETAAKLVGSFHFPYSAQPIGLATGERYPDALAAAAHMASHGGPILLTQPNRLPEATRDLLSSYSFYGPIEVFGGTSSVSNGVAEHASSLILPSRELDVEIGTRYTFQLDKGESIALAFEAEQYDELSVRVDGYQLGGALYRPDLSLHPFDVPFYHKDEYWFFDDGVNWAWHPSLADSGEYRFVLNATHATTAVSVEFLTPVPQQHTISPDSGPLEVSLAAGQDVSIVFEGDGGPGYDLHITKPGHMCGRITVSNADGTTILARNLCVDNDVSWTIGRTIAGRIEIYFESTQDSAGTMTFEVQSR